MTSSRRFPWSYPGPLGTLLLFVALCSAGAATADEMVQFCGRRTPLTTTSIKCRNARLVNLDPLRKLAGLRELDLMYSTIGDVSALGKLRPARTCGPYCIHFPLLSPDGRLLATRHEVQGKDRLDFFYEVRGPGGGRIVPRTLVDGDLNLYYSHRYRLLVLEQSTAPPKGCQPTKGPRYLVIRY